MEKLLFITPELPFPPQSGGKVKSLKLLHALAERYEVTLACPLKGEDARHVDAFHAISPCVDHLHERLDVPRSAYQLATSYARRWPLNVQRTHHPRLARQVAAIADDFDVVMLDHYEVFPFVPASFGGLRVYHAHNAYHKLWERYAALPGNPVIRAASWLEAGRVRRCEAGVARGSDLVFAAPNDAAELKICGVAADRIRNTYHLGDDRQLDLPSLRYQDTEERLMYVGYLGWEANVLGLLWFLEEVWPTLVQRNPKLEFHIVGKGADVRLRNAVAAHPGITLRGFVENLETVYRTSRVSVAPLRFGSGMKVKVLDAMARGMPTVTTSVGAEGIAAESGRHLLIADDPRETVRCVESLLGDPGLWFQLQSESRELVRARYTWRRLFDEMHRDLRSALQRRQHESQGDLFPALGHAA